jgi:hypothetical protein
MVIVRSISSIMTEMEVFQRGRHPRMTNYTPTSVITMLNESVANQIRKLELALQQGLDASNLYNATGQDLDYLVSDRLPEGRLLGSKSLGQITFYRNTPATYAITIPKGTICTAPSTYGSISFQTTEDAVLDLGETQKVVASEAIVPGTKGNVPGMTIVHMPAPIGGIDYINNPLPFSGGEDKETDEELRTRYIYVVRLPGRATPFLIEQHIKDHPNATQAVATTIGFGDLMIVVDAPDNEEVVNDISSIIDDNIAGGVIACACIAARIIAGSPIVSVNTAKGGKIWVRPKDYILGGETITGTYKDPSGGSHSFSAIIPDNTLGGIGILATMESGYPDATEITNLPYTGSEAYDILIGYGTYPNLFLRPKEVPLSVYLKIKKEASFEADLEWKIEQSLRAWIASFMIGVDFEYADMIKVIFRDYNSPNRNFEGIDDIISCYAVGGGIMVASFNSNLTINPDEKITLSSVTVESI